MTGFLTRSTAQQHVADLVARAREDRVRRDLRRARRRFDKAQRYVVGLGLETGVMTAEPLTGVRWGHRIGAAPAR